jgi:ankyrin repeat protein
VTKTSIEEFPLARYAGQYWARHAGFKNVSSQAEDLIKRVFDPENHHFANWVWIYDTIPCRPIHSEGPSRPMRAPLHYAAQHGFSQVAEWLITTCSQDVNVSCLSFSTPLHLASSRGRFAVVQVLLKHRADINAGQHGWTPLHLASCFGHQKVVRLLLEHGVDVDLKYLSGETALRFLSQVDGNLDVAQVLLEYGADPNVRCISGRDSLYMALQKGHQGLAQLLLKHGADPNTRDNDDQTLLHVSSRRGDLKVAQALLELGVDVNSRDNQGRTPLQVAYGEQVVQLLFKHGAKTT